MLTAVCIFILLPVWVVLGLAAGYVLAFVGILIIVFMYPYYVVLYIGIIVSYTILTSHRHV